MNKILLSSLSLTLFLVLAGCGGSSEKTVTQSISEPVTQENVVVEVHKLTEEEYISHIKELNEKWLVAQENMIKSFAASETKEDWYQDSLKTSKALLVIVKEYQSLHAPDSLKDMDALVQKSMTYYEEGLNGMNKSLEAEDMSSFQSHVELFTKGDTYINQAYQKLSQQSNGTLNYIEPSN